METESSDFPFPISATALMNHSECRKRGEVNLAIVPNSASQFLQKIECEGLDV